MNIYFVYKTLETVSKTVKKDLQKRGFVIPTKNQDGSLNLGNFKITKKGDFFVIYDNQNKVIVDGINLPQSAILLANTLTVKRFIDDRILSADRNYGYAEFEENLYKQQANKILKKDAERSKIILSKSKTQKYKKESCRKEIVKQFEKLQRFA